MIVWPLVKAKLVEVIPTIEEFESSTVYDGATPTGDRLASWVAVGWQPEVVDEAGSYSPGSFEQTPGPSGFAAEEAGAVLCELGSTTGDSEIPDVFALAAALIGWVQENQTLDGVLSVNGTASTSVEVLEAQSTAGATQRLLLTLTYTTLVA